MPRLITTKHLNLPNCFKYSKIDLLKHCAVYFNWKNFYKWQVENYLFSVPSEPVKYVLNLILLQI